MNKRVRFLCTILMCGVLFTSECMQISAFASSADLTDIDDEEAGTSGEEEGQEESDDKNQNESPTEETEEAAEEEILAEEIDNGEQEEETLLGEEEKDDEEKEDDEKEVEKEELEEERESIIVSFDTAYGSGTYLISEEGGEWLAAEGDVEIELPEDGSITVQIRADEGCFIVSDQDESRMSEMQIEMSLDHKEEFEDLTVRFETSVTGIVELGSSSGVLGNEFTAQVQIEENVNTEDMYCEWIYQEDALTLLTKEAAWGEENVFKVAAAEERSTAIGAEIYRNNVLLGTLPEAEYQISAIDAAQLLNAFTLVIDEDMEIDLLSEGESVAGGELDFYVEINTEYIESLDHKVEEVVAAYLSNEGIMEQQEDGIFSQTITVEDASDTKAQPKVTIVLDGGIEIAITAQKTLQIDKDAPIIDVSLVDGEKVIQKEWLSQNDGYEKLQMKIDVEDISEIKRCRVSSDKESDYRLSKIGESYYLNVTLREQITDYSIYVEDKSGNAAQVFYTVKIDNTNPSDEVKVSFSGDEKIVCEEEMENGYLLGEGSGDVCSGDHITVNLEVEDGVGRTKIASGIREVQADVLITTREGEEERRYTLDCKGEEGVFFLCIDEEQSDPEVMYQIKEVYIEDHAGNGVTLSREEGCVDETRYVVDHREPEILYNYPQGIRNTKAEDILYYTRPMTGEVELTDLNLGAYEISVKDAAGYSGAEISQTEKSDRKAVYSFALNEDGEYQIDTVLETDTAFLDGSRFVKESSILMIVDTQAPVIEMKLSSEGGVELTDYANQYYKENLHADISIREKNIDLVEVRIFCNESQQALYSQDDFVLNQKKDGCSLQCTLTEEGEYYLEVVCRDKTGKSSEFKSSFFTIDKTPPKVTLTYDNNEANNEFYYNSERTATIQVEDVALDKDSVALKIDTQRSEAPLASEWTEELAADGKMFTAQVKFTKDDIYDVSFTCSDLAGNNSEPCDGGHFVIDTKSPVVKIAFDYNGGKNEIYYKEDRTAHVTIEDLSFDEDAFAVSSEEGEDIVQVKASDIYAGTDWSYAAEIECNEEGAYEFSVQAKDLAGNEAVVVKSEYFIIDKTPPEIEITGVANESANKGDVIPVITYRDKYLDDDQSEINISGYKNGIITIEPLVRTEKESRSLEYDGFPKDRAMDDIYTLAVHIEDKAGNQSEEEYIFSVNRFGSTFSIDKATALLVENYYTSVEQDIVITEVNVDELEKEEITVSFNGEPRTLKEGRDYRVTAQGSSATWKSYTYTILKKNFEKEGQYVVTVFSKDAAENQSDNNVQDLEIAFAVDKTAPSIVVTNLEDHGVYTQEELTFYIDVQDNMCLKGMRLLVNDEEVRTYEEDELTGAVSYKLEASGQPMDITVIAVDAVGNLGEKKFSKILLGETIKAISEEETALSDTPKGAAEGKTVKRQLTGLYLGVFGMIAAAAVLISLVIALRKKKEL